MSKKMDYTKYSKESVKEPAKTVEDAQIIEPVVEPVIEEIVIEEPKTEEPVVEEIVIEEPKTEEPEAIIGVVTNCVKLNVRALPDKYADILGVINASTELAIFEDESTEDFYKICTSTGLEGYCMKKFITIMP